jgi:hypothetical protein
MSSPTTAAKCLMSVALLAVAGAATGCGGSSMRESAASPPAFGGGGDAQAAPPAPSEGGDFEGEADAPPPAAEATAPSQQPQGGAERRSREEAPRDPSSRPGLGTSWGETRNSRITTVGFERADRSTPFVTASLFYNDAEGARSMAAGGPMLPQRRIDVGDGVVSVGLRDGDSGRFLTGFETAGRDYVVGEAGQRYVIVVQNNSSMRMEVVVSVDGLDVIDGRPAGFNKRGYLVDGHGTLEIDGFRQSEDAVAAFRFGSVRDSYAANKKSADARNVGVIGLALFHERGQTPALWREEVRTRQNADPFPARFATPPGG